MIYIIGLDVGISSVGWAVIRVDKDCRRIEDFGVRIFDSGETRDRKQSKCQERRSFRGSRRLIRRRKHRKDRLKYFLNEISFVTEKEMKDFYGHNNHDIIDLRVKGLEERLTPEELTACLFHIAKFRGYKPFYDLEKVNLKTEDGKLLLHMNETNKIIENGGYRSVAEAIQKDSYFKEETTGRYRFHNKSDKNDILFSNGMIKKEAETILNCQKQYYSQLSDKNIEKIIDIIFSRRDFEDGPGNSDDKNRKYTGFYDSIGKCRFYKDKNRGCRFTVLGDVFALINKLSQFKYVSIETGEVDKMPKNLMHTIIMKAIKDASLTKKGIIKIAKEQGFTLVSGNEEKDDNTDITNCLKFVKPMKKIFDADDSGFEWEKLINEDPTNMDSLLNRIGVLLSYNITPNRRLEKLNSISEIRDNAIVERLSKVKLSGTANVSNEYMIDAINAFREGQLYGDFQANVIKDDFSSDKNATRHKKLPPFTKDSEIYDNPVVFRSVNECRKVVNAIIERYGTPSAINIEVASDLNRSAENRKKLANNQKKRRDNNASVLKKIADLLGVEESEITKSQLDRFKLAEQQGWRSMYSGDNLYLDEKGKITDKDKKAIILNTNKVYEIDHIIPFSRILDDSLNNKVLVFAKENQDKSDRTPLMYLKGDSRKEFIKRVNSFYQSKNENKEIGSISKIKYSYLMLDSLTSEEALKYLEEWKIRNLNDTRYISKYLVKYFNDNLLFEENKDSRRPPVYAVKGAITSMLRKQWLNKKTWGNPDKKKLKSVTNLDHAIDAIVIGNCLPAYVEIAVENIKLRDIYYSSGKKKTEEYYRSRDTFIDNLWKFYGVPKSESARLLEKMTETPSLINNLRQEVECRVQDYGTMQFFSKDDNGKTKEEWDEIYRRNITNFYVGQKDFVDSIQMPIVSHKQDKRFRGKIANSNFVKTTDDVSKFYKKQIDENNFAYMDDRSYYCVDVYKNHKGNTKITALKYNDIIKKNGKLYLKQDYKFPEDYREHLMYLYSGDFISVENKNSKYYGYYVSVKNINRNLLNIDECFYENKVIDYKKRIERAITERSIVKKYYIDILGKIGGEIYKCGEPLSYLPEKD